MSSIKFISDHISSNPFKNISLLFFLTIFTGCSNNTKQTDDWISLFNGKDLSGWTIKFSGHDLNDNYKNTFQARDGILRVSYDNHENFENKFGHIFYNKKFSNYKLRLEYRFVGEQVHGGPGWAYRNNGVMLHCQSPQSMEKDQDFPVSIEAQLLGGNGKDERSTGNVCTPGTHIMIEGSLVSDHCITSSSKTFHGDQWVKMEIEVNADSTIRHIINGEVVFEYEKPQLDESDNDAKKLLKLGNSIILSEGYISLQAESHPTEFRNIEILDLKKE